MTSQEIQDKLAAPFPANEIKWKPQTVKGDKALAVAFIDARRVQERLDEVLGVGGWQDEYTVLNDGSVVCQLRVKVDGEWVVKTDVGGMSEQPDAGDKMKSAFSESLKRAAVKVGVGRYIYRLPLTWCPYDGQRRQFTSTPQLPVWALPKQNGQPAPQPQQPPQRPNTPPVQQPQSTPVLPNNGGDVLAGCLGAIGDSKTAVELQAAAFAAKAHIDAKRLAGDGAVKVGDAIQAKLVSLVADAANKSQLDGVYAVYEKSIMPLMNEQRRAAVLQAFNGKTFETAEEEAFA